MTSLEKAGREKSGGLFRILEKKKIRGFPMITILFMSFIVIVSVSSYYLFFYQLPSSEETRINKMNSLPAGKVIIAVKSKNITKMTSMTSMTSTIITTITTMASTTSTIPITTTTLTALTTTTTTIAPPPTCNDSIQNQNEEGIDCGGPCTPCKKSVEEVAMCLSSKGVTVYMKKNCYWCGLIEKYFGTSISSLNVIDCDANRNKDECEDMLDEAENQGKKRGYPTWNIYGDLYPGTPVEEILSMTGCG